MLILFERMTNNLAAEDFPDCVQCVDLPKSTPRLLALKVRGNFLPPFAFLQYWDPGSSRLILCFQRSEKCRFHSFSHLCGLSEVHEIAVSVPQVRNGGP